MRRVFITKKYNKAAAEVQTNCYENSFAAGKCFDVITYGIQSYWYEHRKKYQICKEVYHFSAQQADYKKCNQKSAVQQYNFESINVNLTLFNLDYLIFYQQECYVFCEVSEHFPYLTSCRTSRETWAF